MRTGIFVGLLCLFGLTHSARAAEVAFSDHYLWIDENLVLAGSLDLEALRVANPGPLLVVDLRTPVEGTAETQAQAQKMAMGYVNLPVAGANIDPAQVALLDEILDGAEPDALVVLSCASGNRAGMLWAASELGKGRDLEELLEQVSPIVTKVPVVDAVRAYSERDSRVDDGH